MIHLESDYNNGAEETVLRHLVETNGERTQSYGDDRFSVEARRLILAGMPATRAAAECGFRDYSAFYRAYQKQFHHAPSDDRLRGD